MKIIAQSIKYPLIIFAITAFIVALGSKISSNNWVEWFVVIPANRYLYLIGVLILWAIADYFFRKYYLHDNEQIIDSFLILCTPTKTYSKVGELVYKDVKWIILQPGINVADTNYKQHLNPSEIVIEMMPHCPQCNSELKEKKEFYKTFKWECPKCQFFIKSQKSMIFVREEALLQTIFEFNKLLSPEIKNMPQPVSKDIKVKEKFKG